MKKRSNQLEIIDLGPDYYQKEEYYECLRHMCQINNLLGGTRATINSIKNLKIKPVSILDVGCGGGGLTAQIAQTFIDAKVTGIDLSEEAIAYAREQHNLINLEFLKVSTPELMQEDKSYDVVTATLVCHHLSDEQIVNFLKKAVQVARHAVVINDLHRSWFAYFGFKVISYILFRNRLTQADGALSVKRAFTRKELVNSLASAGFDSSQYKIAWFPMFRWVLTIYSF